MRQDLRAPFASPSRLGELRDRVVCSLMCLPFCRLGTSKSDPQMSRSWPTHRQDAPRNITYTRKNERVLTFARIDLSVAEYDSLTLLVTDGHYVSNSALEASESSSQQRRDTEYAKSPCWVSSTAYRLRSPSQNSPLRGDRETRTHTRLGPTTWRLTRSFRTLAWTLRTRTARSHRLHRFPGSTPTLDACGTRIYGM